MRLIVGNGVIGKLLSAHWKKAEILHHVSTRHRHQMQDHLPFINLSSKAKFSFQEEYSTAILCAGNSNVLECRNDPIGTRMINLDGTINLARYLETQGAQIIFMSSDKVFSGGNGNRSPEDPVDPTTEYGRQKAEAEEEILKLENAAVLRLTKVVHPSQPLLQGWQVSLKLGKPITAFSDMWFAPVSFNMVLEMIDFLIERNAIGIWHVSSTHEITYKAAADHLAECFGADRKLVQPSLSIGEPRYNNEEGSRYASLNMEKTLRWGITPQHPIDTIHHEICILNSNQVVL
jgi:dTDP-4-dehydrorhamnose reductase